MIKLISLLLACAAVQASNSSYQYEPSNEESRMLAGYTWSGVYSKCYKDSNRSYYSAADYSTECSNMEKYGSTSSTSYVSLSRSADNASSLAYLAFLFYACCFCCPCFCCGLCCFGGTGTAGVGGSGGAYRYRRRRHY